MLLSLKDMSNFLFKSLYDFLIFSPLLRMQIKQVKPLAKGFHFVVQSSFMKLTILGVLKPPHDTLICCTCKYTIVKD